MPRDARELGGAWTRHQRHEFTPAPPDLAPFVERFWAVWWDYPESAPPYRQKIVPMPNVQVSVRPGAGPVAVHGVSGRYGVVELSGRGRALGAAFRPGAFRVFADGPVAALTDRTVPARELPVLAAVPSDMDAMSTPDEQATVDVMAAWLRAVLPAPQPPAAGREAGDLVALIASDRSITRVDRLAAVSGTSVRRLQRLFREHVGIGPKWTIRRFRLHETTERMAAGLPVHWADLAAELGYADQAHLSRDFTDVFGESPTWYARRY